MLGMPDFFNGVSSFYYKARWHYKFTFWPRRCNLSKRWIWPLSHAYRGTAIWTGPGTPAVEIKWHNGTEHLIWLLKGNKK